MDSNWKLIPLFSEGIAGDIRVWQIGFDETTSQLKTVYGFLVKFWIVCV